MPTIILTVGVVKEARVRPKNLAVVVVGKKRNVLLPVVFPEGKDLEAKRCEAHRLIDDCVDAFKKLG